MSVQSEETPYRIAAAILFSERFFTKVIVCEMGNRVKDGVIVCEIFSIIQTKVLCLTLLKKASICYNFYINDKADNLEGCEDVLPKLRRRISKQRQILY